MSVITVKNWERHQHYKDRDPKWVKLYRDLLTSESWVLGTDLSRVVQVASILLAARYGNQIPRSWNVLRKVTNLDCTEAQFEEALAHLVATNFLEIQQVTSAPKDAEHSASSPLAKSSAEERREEKRREEERETRAREGPRGTQDAGTALTRSPSAEDALAEVMNVWRDVEDCDEQAMTAWLAHWSRVHAGREMPGHQRIAAAKLLAGLGDAETQQRAVATAEANGWKALRFGDGKAPPKSKAETSADARKASEHVEWTNLRERAQRIGFRVPSTLDDLAGYRTLVERAESNQPRSGSPKTLKDLLGGRTQ